MGARFDIDHINLVAYLTDESEDRAPRTDPDTLNQFLLSLAYERNLISSTQGTAEDWTNDIRNVARHLIDQPVLKFGPLDFANTEARLRPLKPFFTGFDFYALVLPAADGDADRRSFEFFKVAATDSGASGLILLPFQSPGEDVSQFIDPFPMVRQLAQQPVKPPAALFWTRWGAACALPIEAAAAFFRDELLGAAGAGLRASDKAIARKAEAQSAQRILHLSDLHVGDRQAALRRSFLKAHLSALVPTVDRVVVTGDLMDNPTGLNRASFDEFRADLEIHTKKRKPLLVVPGNHDVRPQGNAMGRFGRTDHHVVDLAWDPVVADDDMETLFFSFNSNEIGNWAKGGVSLQQRLQRAEQYERLVHYRPEVETYLKIALVHHHPVDYGSQPVKIYEHVMRMFGGEQQFIAFEGSSDFLRWCAGRDIDFVLHGHKHIPHLAGVPVAHGSKDHFVTVVGCGSSVGAEGKPMCYDILTFNADTRDWSVAFHHDERGDGSGFTLQNVALDLRPHL